MRLFHKPGDYLAFLQVLCEGLERCPLELFTYAILPNHWHLVVRPAEDDALSRWLGWIGVTHVRRHHQHYESRGGGHLYQGRYKSFPVSSDEHFITLCRYVEANPRRAKLVAKAEAWRWSALGQRANCQPGPPLAPWPVPRPDDWLERVNRKLPTDTISQLRESVARGRPFGEPDWVTRTAERLGLEFTLRNPGRPRKATT